MELKFRRDTSFRKQFFTPESFAHPAKMDAHLLLWIVGKYTKPGEVILDPMAGMGTTMLACTVGRNVVLVELEEKFCNMCKSNWEKVSAMPQLGYEMGQCNIIQGDARQLEGLVDKIVTSPPYVIDDKNICHTKEGKTLADYDKARGFKPTVHPTTDYSTNPSNIGNLPYGQIDKIVTSPPFVPDDQRRTRHIESDESDAKRGYKPMKGYRSYYSQNPDNIGNPGPYGNIDSIITSPPYEAGMSSPEDALKRAERTNGFRQGMQDTRYAESRVKFLGSDPSGLSNEERAKLAAQENNIGNLKGDTYLEAMFQVYQQCHKVLKYQGLMILVTKNFIRNKQVIRLDEDTIKLCEQAGFSFVERHYRKLTSQSFWRIIYHQKYPGVEKIEHEDVLIFRKLTIHIKEVLNERKN